LSPALGYSAAKSGIIFAIALFLQQPLNRGLDAFSGWLQRSDRLTANDDSIHHLFQYFKRRLRDTLWLGASFLSSYVFQLTSISLYLLATLKIFLAIAGGVAILKASDVVIDSADAFYEAYIKRNDALKRYGRLRNLVPFMRRCLEYAVYIGTSTLVVAQITPLIPLTTFGTQLIKVLGLVFISRILIEINVIFLADIVVGKKKLTEEQHKRRRTLVPVLQSFFKYGVYFWAGILTLKIISIDPAPILAAAGIIGLAVGLGAQNLINDTVSGFFILLENYFLVGDYIITSEAEGVVESIELRTTRIRHPNGQLQILRNGDITSIVNYSREYIYAVVDVGVAYDSDLNHVYRVIEAVGQEIQQMFPNDVLEPTEVDGVEEFAASKLIVRTVTKLKPNNSRRGVHDDVQGELRKVLKEAFEQAGIIIPVIQTVGVLSSDESSS
ncbi:MAG: mechanosensitive ion channel family protein, partial [Symploca sp. SIO2B6]|nr:mechanosensitive ion channel family protein [Symploca sp. SIO2B6]